MKTLLVLRHGKSSWASPGLGDHDRPLKGRGRRAAVRMGEELKGRDLVPDLILSSTAERARATAEAAAEAAGCADRVKLTRELYLSGVDHQLRTVATHASKEHQRVMIVGHNPTLEDLVEHLTGEDVRLTTGNLACIDLDVESWRQLPGAKGELRFVLRPRELS
jgi:phosphohistidine phosphatase